MFSLNLANAFKCSAAGFKSLNSHWYATQNPTANQSGFVHPLAYMAGINMYTVLAIGETTAHRKLIGTIVH
jgi:hypothetical protein